MLDRKIPDYCNITKKYPPSPPIVCALYNPCEANSVRQVQLISKSQSIVCWRSNSTQCGKSNLG